MGFDGQGQVPAALPSEKARYLVYSSLCWSQGWSGRVQNTSPKPGFESRNVQNGSWVFLQPITWWNAHMSSFVGVRLYVRHFTSYFYEEIIEV